MFCFNSNLSSSGCSLLIFINKELGYWLVICLTLLLCAHVGRVCDITDIDAGTKWKHSHSQSCFHNFQTFVFNKQDVNLSEKWLCVHFLFNSY